MWKYRSQTLISMIGLAVGFVCYAFALLWIRYEMSYDAFHTKAKQIYVVYIQGLSQTQSGYSNETVYPLAAYLKKTFPEIANAAPLTPADSRMGVTVGGVNSPALVISADSSYFQIFDAEILEGSREFLIPGNRKMAITPQKARQLFGDENPIGKTLKYWTNDYTICAIVTGMTKHSNYPFDFIQPFQSWVTDSSLSWMYLQGPHTILELHAGINIEAFEKKLFDLEIPIAGFSGSKIHKMTIKPITKMHYTDPEMNREVRFQHLVIFLISGLLVVVCALFNYLTLFVSRFRMRHRELALRVVSGASGSSLLAMLSVEFILTTLFAVTLAGFIAHSLYEPFVVLSVISMDLTAIFGEMLLYIAGVILVSLLLFWLILYLFRRRTLNTSIRRSNSRMFRKTSIVAQIVISIGFAFCTSVIMKQMYFLHHTGELGFSFQNRGSIEFQGDKEVLINKLKQLPEITEVVDARFTSPILPYSGYDMDEISEYDDKPADVDHISIGNIQVLPSFIAFYEFQLVAGELLTEGDPETMVLLNEEAVKTFGWHDPIGKQFEGPGVDFYTVKGVIRHTYNFAPTIPATPVCYSKMSTSIEEYIISGKSPNSYLHNVLFKYQKDMWKSLKAKIEQMKDEFKIAMINNDEEIYNEYLKSERVLIGLLSIISVVCLLICVFGFVSLVSLTCEERRKAIAIHKINGATVGDILAMFIKEYALLLSIGAVIAFSIAYLIMQRWLEHYVKQTDIPAWIYLSILFVMAIVIVLCVGWQVYKTSVENPAEVINN